VRNIKVTLAGIVAAALMFNGVVSAESWVDKAKKEKPNAERFFKETNLNSGFHKDRPRINSDELGRRLDRMLGGMKGYKYGDESGDVANFRTTMESAYGNRDLQRLAEKRFIAYLQTDASYQAKQMVCRELRKIGSGECVAVLGKMLVDPEFSDMGRYALECNMSAGADEAFVAAVDKTNGQVKAGIINSIGVRRSAAATDTLAKLVNAGDSMVAEAAIAALGQIGTVRSAEILQKAKGDVSRALIRCANRISESDKEAAGKIYAGLSDSRANWRIRVAAVKGMLELKPTGTKLDGIVDDVADALTSSDAENRAIGVAVVGALPGDSCITRKIAGVVNKCEPYVQEQLIYSLGERGDSAALDAVSAAADSKDTFVRQASLETLGRIGNASSIVLLANKNAKGSKEEKEIALTSLRRLKGEGIENAFSELIKSGPEGSRRDVIYAVGQRRMYQAFDDMYQIAKNEDNARIRREAILSLGYLSKADQIDKLVGLATYPKEVGDGSAIEKSVVMVFELIKDKNAQAKPVIATFKDAPDEAKPLLLKLLNKPATREAFDVVSSAVKSSNPKVSDAAIRSLGDWPNYDAADVLYSIASGSSSQLHSVLALRGYVRMAQMADDPVIIYSKAMKLAKRPQEVTMVLSGLGSADSFEAIEVVKKYMQDERFKPEAFNAAINISSRYCWHDYSGTKSLMESIMAQTPSKSIRDKAGKVIDQMNRFNGNIFKWYISELYKIDGKNGDAAFW